VYARNFSGRILQGRQNFAKTCGTLVEAGTKVGNAAGGFDGAQKADPGHGIENAGLEEIDMVAGNGCRGAGFVAEAGFHQRAPGICF
jgi:hypothetical protein